MNLTQKTYILSHSKSIPGISLTDLNRMDVPQNYVFFLGGRDLEMVEIRKILKDLGFQEGIHFHDRNLEWNTARLSAYADLFSKTKINVCIELQEDMTPPALYLSIDHHNEKSHLPPSIVQIAELLGFPLSRDHLLVGANDRAYIPGMLELQATEAEIADIRQRDRKAQGVTETQEEQAVLDIENAFKNGKVTVVNTTLKKFSPITDRLFKHKHLLIYNADEMTYYGPARDQLAKHFAAEVKAGKAYYGGTSSGFFGFGKGAFHPPDTLQHTVEVIIDIVNAS